MKIQRRIVLPSVAVLVVLLSAGVCLGQGPTKAAPDSYRLQLENDHVKVLRVRYAADGEVPVHGRSRGQADGFGQLFISLWRVGPGRP